MKQKINGFMLLAVGIILLAACGKKGPSYTQYIPKDATYVVSMDVKSLVTKLEKDSLTVENMLEAIKDSSDPSKYAKAIEMWKQFKDAGLDFDNKVFVAVPSFDMNAGNVTVQMIAGLKDEKKLEAFIAKTPDAPKVTKDGDISYAITNDMIVGWKKDAVMILGGHSTPKMKDAYPGDDSTNALAPALVPGAGTDLLAMLKKYFALKKDESLASVKVFTDLTVETGDIAIFTNSNSLAGSNANPALTMMPKVKELLEGIYSTSIVNFEDGKMVMKTQTFVGPKLADILKKYAGPEVDLSLVDPYPSNNVNGVVAFSFKPELIPEVLKAAGVNDLIDGFLSQQGMSTAEIMKAFKGDFAIMFSNFSMAKVEKKNWEDETYTSYEPSAKVLMAVRINDKVAFEKLLSMGTKSGSLLRKGNRLIPARNGVADSSQKFVAGIEKDLLVFCNDETVYSDYVAQKSKIGLSDEVRTGLKGKSIAFFMDAEKILNSIPETMFDTTDLHEKNVLARSKATFKTIDFTTGNFDGKKLDGQGELIMASNKNSLPQLVRFLMFAAEEMKMKSAEDKAKWSQNEVVVDSTMIEPAE